MANMNEVDEVMHRVRVKLYPNYLPGIEGAYIARTDDEANLDVEQVCAAMKNRGGFSGNYGDLVSHVKAFFDEQAYQLCDGYTVHNDYYTVLLKVGKTFATVTDGVTTADHPLAFRIRAKAKLLQIAKDIKIVVDGFADVQGYIDEVIDVSTSAVNETLTPGSIAVIKGARIKAEGPNPAVGVFIIHASGAETRITGGFGVNEPTRIDFVVPPLAPEEYTLKIVTQYSHGGIPLKEPRIINFAMKLVVL